MCGACPTNGTQTTFMVTPKSYITRFLEKYNSAAFFSQFEDALRYTYILLRVLRQGEKTRGENNAFLIAGLAIRAVL